MVLLKAAKAASRSLPLAAKAAKPQREEQSRVCTLQHPHLALLFEKGIPRNLFIEPFKSGEK
jgi:hypothetical protein